MRSGYYFTAYHIYFTRFSTRFTRVRELQSIEFRVLYEIYTFCSRIHFSAMLNNIQTVVKIRRWRQKTFFGFFFLFHPYFWWPARRIHSSTRASVRCTSGMCSDRKVCASKTTHIISGARALIELRERRRRRKRRSTTFSIKPHWLDFPDPYEATTFLSL